MKREYEIVNLHCGGCASKIQYELDKVKEIKDVNVDFYTKK
ncbi:MAG: heavy-metal-associated domain-containing protein, partial [Cetobacterium sp.]